MAGIYIPADILVGKMGISLGFGIKFGVANNQIDFAYKYGVRTSDLISDETIQHFTVGLQLGDLWFVKRRPK